MAPGLQPVGSAVAAIVSGIGAQRSGPRHRVLHTVKGRMIFRAARLGEASTPLTEAEAIARFNRWTERARLLRGCGAIDAAEAAQGIADELQSVIEQVRS